MSITGVPNLLRKTFPFWICCVSILLAFLPYLISGADTIVRSHDHLDSNLVWSVAAAKAPHAGLILAGVEANYYQLNSSLYNFAFVLFPPFKAFLLVEAITRLLAFVGMYLLLRDFVLRSTGKTTNASPFSEVEIVILGSLAAAVFALLPFWLPGGASVAGVAWFFWSVLRVREGIKTLNHLLLISTGSAFFVFFGSLFLSGLFVLIFSSCLLLYDVLQRAWRNALRIFVFNAIISSLFIIESLKTFEIFFLSETTHRSEMNSQSFWFDLVGSLLLTLKNMFKGQNHADPGVTLPLVLAVIIAAVIGVKGRLKKHERFHEYAPLLHIMAAAMTLIGVTALAYGLWHWSALQNALEVYKLPSFNMSRFHWLQPALWGVVFAASLGAIWKGAGILQKVSEVNETQKDTRPAWRVFLAANLGPSLVVGLVIAQSFAMVTKLPAYQTSKKSKLTRYGAFYAPDLFTKMRVQLGAAAKNARLGVIGMHPAIAQYNGFATVGGYLAVYPLRVKHEFRKIIERELSKSTKWRDYFDLWGSRAYLFSHDLEKCGGDCTMTVAPASITYDLNITAFKNFGGTHLLSVSKISNAEQLGLKLMGEYKETRYLPRERWRFYLYEFVK